MMNRLFFILALIISQMAHGRCIDSLIDLKGSEYRTSKEYQPDRSMLKVHTRKKAMITIHYTAEPQNKKSSFSAKMQGLVSYSKTGTSSVKKELWGDMPYNYFIDYRGKSAEGRSTAYRPNTNTKYDPNGHIAIVVEGNNDSTFSLAQKQKLFAMIKALQNDFEIETAGVGVHRHHVPTSCPGPVVEGWVREYKVLEAKLRPNKQACDQSTPGVEPKPAVQVKPKTKPTQVPAVKPPRSTPRRGTVGEIDDDATR